jgi:hypothetical protein
MVLSTSALTHEGGINAMKERITRIVTELQNEVALIDNVIAVLELLNSTTAQQAPTTAGD